ncbi:unnamed protein product [Prunus armeniaca]
MVESEDVSLQIHEYPKLVNELKNEDVDLPETFDYKNNMRHKRKEMSFEDLIVHIRIEEKNRMQDKVIRAKEISSKANVIEAKSSKHYNKSKFSNAKHDNRSQPKHENKLRSTNNQSNFKKKGSCFVCGKPGHHAHECRHRRRDDIPARANMIKADDIIVAVISEINMGTNAKDWVVDSGATRHIYGNRNAFTSYTPLRDGEEHVFMG